MYFAQPNPIRIIARSKRSLLGHHWGVQLPDGRVIHLTPEGAFLVSLEEFAEGKTWRVVREADPNRYNQIIWRVDAALRQPQQYRLTDRNCEVFANELLGDPPESPQVQSVALIAVLAVVIKALS
jgi:hypothetical protein